MRVSLLILILVLNSCESGDGRVNEFIMAAFTLKQGDNNGATYFYPELNESISNHNEFGQVASENMFTLRYLLWNLIDHEMPPEVRYSYHDLDETIEKFYTHLKSNKKVTDNLEKLLNRDQAFDYKISTDSLVSVASKLFFAKDLGAGRIQWTVCSGKSIFPNLYSEKKYFETVLIQAFCYQAIYNNTSIDGDNIFDRMDLYISDIMPLLYGADSLTLEELANQEMWTRMSSDLLLREIIFNEYEKQKNNLFFQLH